MGGHHHHHHHHGPLEARSAETRRVTLVGAVVNLLLAVVKIVFGYIGRSHALIVDGIHSLSDLLSDVVVWYAATHAGHGPDDEHPYGHGRFETAATLGLGAMLVLVAGGIVWDSLERFFYSEPLWEPTAIALYFAIFSILANEGLFWYTFIVARRIKSDMLMANAWHHRSDAISSIVVVVGIGGSLLGYPWLDVVAALIVGLMVAKIGWDLGWNAMQELVDVSLDQETVERLRDVIQAVDGVRSLHMLRTRSLGHEATADVHVQVAPWLSVSEGHMISIAVEEAIKSAVDEINDVTVHIDPEDDEHAPPCKGLPLRDEATAQLQEAWKDIAHLPRERRIILHYLAGNIDVEILLSHEDYRGEQAAHELSSELKSALADRSWFGKIKLHFG